MPRVAIACQGGGSHTAFTAGVLAEALPWLAAQDCELVGLSGSSGGAVSAVAAWYGYLTDGPEGACATLEALWDDVAARGPVERTLNRWLVWNVSVQNNGAPVPTLSPYQLPFSELGKREFLETLETHVDFDAVPDLVGPETPEMVVGTVNVNAGEFETFANEEITPEAVLASAAVPTLFEAVEIHGHLHWDGLFSQNPPVNDLMTVDAARKPEELWIVQINPQTSAEEPTSLEAINDRRNELAGNISLNQELRFIEQVNDWVDNGDLPADAYTKTTVRRIVLDAELSHSSKMDRSRTFLEELYARGRDRAASFLAEVEADLEGAGATPR